jgi:hypothetical protein
MTHTNTVAGKIHEGLYLYRHDNTYGTELSGGQKDKHVWEVAPFESKVRLKNL